MMALHLHSLFTVLIRQWKFSWNLLEYIDIISELLKFLSNLLKCLCNSICFLVCLWQMSCSQAKLRPFQVVSAIPFESESFFDNEIRSFFSGESYSKRLVRWAKYVSSYQRIGFVSVVTKMDKVNWSQDRCWKLFF